MSSFLSTFLGLSYGRTVEACLRDTVRRRGRQPCLLKGYTTGALFFCAMFFVCRAYVPVDVSTLLPKHVADIGHSFLILSPVSRVVAP